MAAPAQKSTNVMGIEVNVEVAPLVKNAFYCAAAYIALHPVTIVLRSIQGSTVLHVVESFVLGVINLLIRASTFYCVFRGVKTSSTKCLGCFVCWNSLYVLVTKPLDILTAPSGGLWLGGVGPIPFLAVSAVEVIVVLASIFFSCNLRNKIQSGVVVYQPQSPPTTANAVVGANV